MNRLEFKFVGKEPDYEFSSFVQTEDGKRVNCMHVMAQGTKLDNLQRLVEQHLKVTEKQDITEQYGKTIGYSGNMQGVDYKVILEWGACPTLDGAEGHSVIVRSSLDKEDKLSPIVAEEMKKYEIERTQHIQEVNRVFNEQ